jgi:hypothetical protein
VALAGRAAVENVTRVELQNRVLALEKELALERVQRECMEDLARARRLELEAVKARWPRCPYKRLNIGEQCTLPMGHPPREHRY